jgi:hypothetical protein
LPKNKFKKKQKSQHTLINCVYNLISFNATEGSKMNSSNYPAGTYQALLDQDRAEMRYTNRVANLVEREKADVAETLQKPFVEAYNTLAEVDERICHEDMYQVIHLVAAGAPDEVVGALFAKYVRLATAEVAIRNAYYTAENE